MFKSSNIEDLILPLRVQIGDTDGIPTFSDEKLHIILLESVASLMNRWGDKYYITNDGVVRRNSNVDFEWSSPPEIQHKDRRPIVLQASILIKSGAKFSESGSVASWRDEEISYSNIESARQRSSTLEDDQRELESILPSRKLARPKYGRLFGWKENYN